MIEKNIKVVVKDYYGNFTTESDPVQLDLDLAREDLYTDWNVYKGIIFHIISNAIKFSAKNQNLLFQVRFVKLQAPEFAQNNPLCSYLETNIINFGAKFENKSVRRFKTFAFGVVEEGETNDMKQGIGIGLSTADALASALGGRV